MRRKKVYPYFFLIGTLFFLLSFPDKLCQKMRFFAISSVAPTWHSCQLFKEKFCVLLAGSTSSLPISEEGMEALEELKRENHLLSSQLINLKQLLFSKDRVEEQIFSMKNLDPLESEAKWKDYFSRRRAELSAFLKLQLRSLPAKVIYREPSSWSSFVWLNMGEKQNAALQEKIIAKNSPVVIGNALIGVVEEVGETKCKVRLITDANLFPAVRSVRGSMQDRILLEKLEKLSQILEAREDLFESFEERSFLFSQIQKIGAKLTESKISLCLAKGELQGSSHPLWRSRGQILKGVGFNYDFPDEEGGARDLRTGALISEKEKKESISLLKEGDLLVTSGLDGVFPAGIEVAIVSKVFLLKEGASSYEIEAKAIIENFDELSTVFILPPIN